MIKVKWLKKSNRFQQFKNKKILLVIGGGISAYKSLDLIRFLKKDSFEIKTVLTRSGKQFVTPLSLVSLSGGKVYENLFDKENEAEINHIALSRWADLMSIVLSQMGSLRVESEWTQILSSTPTSDSDSGREGI